MEIITLELTARQWLLLADCVKYELKRSKEDAGYSGELKELGQTIINKVNGSK